MKVQTFMAWGVTAYDMIVGQVLMPNIPAAQPT
jgi:hypothetical protein